MEEDRRQSRRGQKREVTKWERGWKSKRREGGDGDKNEERRRKIEVEWEWEGTGKKGIPQNRPS